LVMVLVRCSRQRTELALALAPAVGTARSLRTRFAAQNSAFTGARVAKLFNEVVFGFVISSI
jgi:hypothetical protein